MEPISLIVGLATNIFDRIFPDPAIAAQAKAELAKMQLTGELANVAGQLEVNKAEASNPSVFVSGWRPFIGWVCGFGLGYSFLGQPLVAWYATIHTIPVPPALDMGTLLTVLGGMLGLGGLRTVEKLNGVDRK